MSGEDGNEEFYRQLQLQQQYEAEPGGEGESDPFTYVDPADGAAYEWDREKKAWFPKVGAGVASALPEGGRAGGPSAPCPLPGVGSGLLAQAAALSAGGWPGPGRGPLPSPARRCGAALSPRHAEVSPRKGEDGGTVDVGSLRRGGVSLGFGQIDVCCEVSVAPRDSVFTGGTTAAGVVSVCNPTGCFLRFCWEELFSLAVNP